MYILSLPWLDHNETDLVIPEGQWTWNAGIGNIQHMKAQQMTTVLSIVVMAVKMTRSCAKIVMKLPMFASGASSR